MKKFPFKKPSPNFDKFRNILDGNKIPDKVYFVELWIDEEVKKLILEKFFNEKNISPLATCSSKAPVKASEDTKIETEIYYKQLINFRYNMGLDFITEDKYMIDFLSLFSEVLNLSKDTAIYSKGNRAWAQEGTGLLKTWEDFEKFPWEKSDLILSDFEAHLDFLGRNLTEGMKIAVTGSLFELIIERVLGYENFFYLIYDQPSLVESVIDRIGQIVHKLYSVVVSRESVGVLLLADDLGYKTSSIISIEHLRKWFFPWYYKYSIIAHKNNKHIWYHCCGYKYDIMKDLIEDIKFDAIHGFEDSNSPIIKFKEKYGYKIALLGSVDMDKLIRLNEKDLRNYVNNILDICMTGSRFDLGSGNSFCNYMPVENYLIMVEEGLKWNN